MTTSTKWLASVRWWRQDWLIYLPFEQIVCLATLLLSLTFTSSSCLCVSRKYWRLDCPLQIKSHYHDNHTTSWDGMMLIMATVAGSQPNSLALPQGQGNVWIVRSENVCAHQFLFVAQTFWRQPHKKPQKSGCELCYFPLHGKYLHLHNKGFKTAPVVHGKKKIQTHLLTFHPPISAKKNSICFDTKNQATQSWFGMLILA